MRTSRLALGALVVLLLLIFCSDSDAGRFCRPRCNNCCAIPCWVRWFDYDGHNFPPHPDGSAIRAGAVHCFCCQKGSNRPMNCDGGTSQCIPGSTCQVNGDVPPPNMCGSGGYGGGGCAFQGCTTGCVRLYAMVYDPCCHVLRFALPCETWQVYAPLWCLGLPPVPPYK